MTQSNQCSNLNCANRLRNGAIALVLLAGTVAVSACGYDEPVVEEPVTDPEVAVEEPMATEEPAEVAEAYNVQLGELTGNVEDYLGQSVSVRGEAEVAVDENSFLLQDDALFGGQEVIVFNATGEPFLLPTADEPTEDVQVTGEVRQLVIADLETEYGLDLDPEIYAEYEDRPAIIAESIAFSPDPEEITEEPGQYYGQPIAVSGVVGEMLSPGTFRLEEEGWFEGDEVLVIGANVLPTVDEAEEVVVTGTLRPFVASEFEQEYDLTWDLDLQEQIEAEFTERPVLVADEVYLGAQ
jgi:hypothetical protein